MLLPGAADAADRAQIDAGRTQIAEQKVQRLDPHQRVALLDAGVVVGEEAVRRLEPGQPRAELDAPVDHLPTVGVDDQRGQALRAGIEAQESHRIRERITAAETRLSGREAPAPGRIIAADQGAIVRRMRGG